MLPPVIADYGVTFNLDRTKFDLIKRTVCPSSATDDEIALFFHECARKGTHPMDRLIVMAKFAANDEDDDNDTRVVFMTTIDYLRAQAQVPGDYAGTEQPVYGPTKRFRYTLRFGKGPRRKEESGVTEVPEWAMVRGHKMVGDRKVPIEGVARWDEFYPGPRRGRMWIQMPFNQLGKCAEAQMLRKGWPRRLQQLYTTEELAARIEYQEDHGGRGFDYLPQPADPTAITPTPVTPVDDPYDIDASETPPAERWQITSVNRVNGKRGTGWRIEAENGSPEPARQTYWTEDRVLAEQLRECSQLATIVAVKTHAKGKALMLDGFAPVVGRAPSPSTPG